MYSEIMLDSDLYKTVLRARWDGRDVDHKAVGGHLPLTKRNSTPVGASLAAPSAHVQLLHAHAKATLTPIEPPNMHRRLDRSHSEPVKGGEGRQANSSRYKTELCRPFEENGFCKYGDKCQFAHGHAELRTLSRHPKYKTELCRTFHTIGFCPYGPRCHFIHNAEERRGNSAGPSSHPPLSPKTSLSAGHPALSRPQMLQMGVAPLGSTAESPSPPASLHGSPTSSGGSFFDDAFTLFPGGCGLAGAKGFLDGLSVGLGSSGMSGGPGSPGGSSCGGRALSDLDLVREGTLLSLAGLDTPPVSPVESLAGDLDSLSLSSSHSASPTPATSALDISRSLRLPIFEQLCEQD
ncbi:mRNA decay activator protein ZFP36L1-like isoform X2 [Homarus americanus]|uniref:mRNA decay activator protein ZFP36L1-like isoform X2 n=1 Tax=Homarus americanus TaxID=6706 RepID=UPI001C491DD1|nr:mRNA decay activator protein ZFP36L1-like isoform X2 [Homarus americanus]